MCIRADMMKANGSKLMPANEWERRNFRVFWILDFLLHRQRFFMTFWAHRRRRLSMIIEFRSEFWAISFSYPFSWICWIRQDVTTTWIWFFVHCVEPRQENMRGNAGNSVFSNVKIFSKREDVRRCWVKVKKKSLIKNSFCLRWLSFGWEWRRRRGCVKEKGNLWFH